MTLFLFVRREEEEEGGGGGRGGVRKDPSEKLFNEKCVCVC